MRVFDLKNIIEANKISQYLEEAGLAYHIVKLEEEELSGVFRKKPVWGYVEAPAEYRDEVRKVCEDVLEEEKNG